jgi:methyltransferase (TIGR00027 family)
MGARAAVLLRSRYAEDRLEAAAERGIQQYVILGAGLDSFPHRQPPWARTLSIFEVDQPASQLDKRRRVAHAGLKVPDNLTYVAIDFDEVTLRDGLAASGLNFAEPAFFSCLGVLGYLTREAALAIFELVSEFPKGSEIVFSFYPAPGSLPTGFSDFVKQVNEPLRTFFQEDVLMRDLKALGFGEVALLSPEEAQRRYFTGRGDALTAPQWLGLAAAVVR